MKNILLICVVSMSFFACKKEEKPAATTTTTTPGDGTMKCSIDGVAFSSDATYTAAAKNGDGYTFSAPQSPGPGGYKAIAISLHGVPELVVNKTYPLKGYPAAIGEGFGSYSPSYGVKDSPTSSSDSTNSGSITITKYDAAAKKVSGTFNFKAIDGKTKVVTAITAGTFDDVNCQ